MAKSGVKVDDEVTKTYEDIKTKKEHRWMLMKITPEPDKKVIVEEVWKKTDDQVADFNELRKRLELAEENKECRFAIADISFSLGESGLRNKLCYIIWAPDTSKVRERMVYSSTSGGLKDAIGQGIAEKIQANDKGDLDLNDIIEKLKKK